MITIPYWLLVLGIIFYTIGIFAGMKIGLWIGNLFLYIKENI